jgi:hypothetical protein
MAKVKLASNRVLIELYSRDITAGQFRKLYFSVRETLNVVRAKPLKEDDRAFLDFVSRLGDEPENDTGGGETKQAFWDRALRQWNREHVEEKYKEWIGLYRRYHRLRQRLSGRPPASLTRNPSGVKGR